MGIHDDMFLGHIQLWQIDSLPGRDSFQQLSCDKGAAAVDEDWTVLLLY